MKIFPEKVTVGCRVLAWNESYRKRAELVVLNFYKVVYVFFVYLLDKEALCYFIYLEI